MLFRQLFDRDSSTYTYLLGDEESRKSLLVDPVLEQINRDLQLLNELDLKLEYIIETHIHADHITAAAKLKEITGCKTLVPSGAKIGCADHFIKNKEIIELGGITIQAINTPGHTDSHMSYLVNNERVLTGDALLIRGCGRTDFQGGDAGHLYDSVQNGLFTLPDSILVYPAHDYHGYSVSTIGEEKLFNPRFSHRNREDFIEFMEHLHLALPDKIMEALPANEQCGQLTDQPD